MRLVVKKVKREWRVGNTRVMAVTVQAGQRTMKLDCPDVETPTPAHIKAAYARVLVQEVVRKKKSNELVGQVVEV